MLNLLTFIIGIVFIFCLARYNRSNKLFWLLFISMMCGFVGGTIASNLKSEKKNNVEYVTQTMTLQSTPIAQFVPLDKTEDVPTVNISAVNYNTAERHVILKLLTFKTLYHEGLSPFIFDSS